MKNNYSRLVIIALITIIVFLYALTVKGYAAGLPAALQENVTGVVTDEQGMPLPGVTVTVKGTNRGTATNIDGEYEIAVDAQGTLVFSFMGFKKAEVAVAGRREINISLAEDITALDEVEINAGYYNTTRRESTGNISRVTAEEIELQPVVSPLQALQGRMAGVEIISGGSHPGMAPTIRIRGRNSLREEGNYPLYIIDGVPINSTPVDSNTLLGNTGIDPLSTLNLSNIQSIEVLKDADATAIYGSRGANGVILITTKDGKSGEKELEVTYYTGSAWIDNRIDLLHTQQYLDLRRKAFENDGLDPTVNNAYDLVSWDLDRYTDWQDFFFGGSSAINKINFSTTGGKDKTFYRLGGSYQNQGTVFPADYSYQKITSSFNLSHSSEDDKLSIQLSVNYGIDISDLIGNLDLTFRAFSLPPNAPSVFNEEGGLNWEDWSVAPQGNPLQGFFNSSTTRSNNLNSGLLLSYELFPGLIFKTNFGYTSLQTNEIVKRPKRSYNPLSGGNFEHSSSNLYGDRSSWIIEPQISYKQNLDKLQFNALLGTTFQESDNNIFGIQSEGYVSEDLIGNLNAAENLISTIYSKNKYRYNALFGRLGLNWDKKYIINLTGRRDGSSRFGPGNQWGNFGAIGTAWIFSEEKLLPSSTFLSFGKLRVSYGTTGNDQIGDYGYLDAYEATPGPGGLYPTQLANPDYSWEVNRKFEAGLELGFFKDKLFFEISHYHNRSSNQLVGYVLPSITGFSTIQANLPATVENTGWEGYLSSRNFEMGNFKWQTSLNLSFPKNELKEFPDLHLSSYANTYKIGEPLNISLFYEYQGLDPETGFYSVADVNEDGRIDYQDRVNVQTWDRDFYGGLSNSFSFNSFHLQFLLEFAKQEGRVPLFNVGGMGNQRAEVINALEPGSEFQRISDSQQSRLAYSYIQDTYFPIVDASYLKLRSFTLSYFIPSLILDTFKLKTGKIFLTGQDLLTLTDYKGLDVELPRLGIQLGGLSSLTAGVQLQF